MRIQVFSRSNNDELYEMMRSLIPPDVECIKVTGFDEWTDASDYLYHILDTAEEYAINIDIDCFVYDWGRVIELVHFIDKTKTTHAGPRDGGDMLGRYHSWVHMNPFFNIFNAKLIRELKGETSWEEIQKSQYNEEWYPETVFNFDVFNDNVEPFAGLFYWLYDKGRPYFLSTRLHSDGISTRLSSAALHSWYSREFKYDLIHRQRIINLYNEAISSHSSLPK